MTTATVTNIRQLIRERVEVASEPDPHVIAAALAAEADEEMAREALNEALVALVRQEMRAHRYAHRQAGSLRSNREGYAEALRSIFDNSYYVGDGQWKFLGDFTRADALSVQQDYEQRAAANTHEAQRFAALAKKLKGDRTARELGEAVVGEIFYA